MIQHQLLPVRGRVLVAVSGGIDSMTMLHLFASEGIDCAIAHCNFGLRGDESDNDEAFVRQKAHEYGFAVQVAHFDTMGNAAKQGISIQMSARELRYRWFDELLEQLGYDRIAIAHNRDDKIETLFINLARGTSIRGLTSIKPKNGNIIRPLLFASREEIVDYVNQHQITFREDSSNMSDKYARNYIRHHLIPGLKAYFPGVQQSIEHATEHLSGVEAFYSESVERFKQQIIKVKDQQTYIDLQGLMKSPSSSTLLYETIKPFGFSRPIVTEVLGCTLESHSGRQFFSHTHHMLCDRQQLIIEPIKKEDAICEYIITPHCTELSIPIRLKMAVENVSSKYEPERNSNVACIDEEKLNFPLILRRWQQGDSFYPLGMINMKKLSDFFIDKKLSLIDKEHVWILTSAGQIVWIVGLRIDNRFRITSDTKRMLKIVYEP